MLDLVANAAPLLAATETEEGGNFLVTPGIGLMIWTLVTFGITFLILKVSKSFGFTRIQEAIERRQNLIAESIQHAEQTRKEADELMDEYRQRLAEARAQADDIVARARKAADQRDSEAQAAAEVERQELLAQTKREIELETQRAMQDLRREVASLTIQATEKVTRKSLTGDDQTRLVEEALGEVDFSALAGGARNN